MSELPKPIEERVQHMLPRNLLHDLRTPLGHILGYSELLIEEMQDRVRSSSFRMWRKSGRRGMSLWK